MTLLHRDVTAAIIDAAVEVHEHLGPGLLESTYEECLCIELAGRRRHLVRQTLIPVTYKGRQIDAAYRPDLIVDKAVIVELKCVEKLGHVHHAQLLTYLRHTGLRVGLLFNFNTAVLTKDMKRIIL